MEWAEKNQTSMIYIRPGKPTQDAYVERFNRTARQEWLVLHQYELVKHAQLPATKWIWVEKTTSKTCCWRCSTALIDEGGLGYT